ncbi:MAG: homoserine dehydrogenase [Ruminococcaceae bacterium]|nr:homoserine dehydrogenase [Oscillospiraceae bacterium]
MKNIALLGFGTVGSGVAELIDTNYDYLCKNIGDEINIKYILDIRDFKGHPLEKKFTKNFDDILNDDEVSIVVEMIGGSHPAYDFTLAALKAGKNVVTSNKEVVANFGVELLKVAYENSVSYLFEASVGGGIPIIRPMMNSLCGEEILKIDGILNGTTNYILTQMFENNTPFDEALKNAQQLGYAEANPAADVEGTDVCRKICILTAIATGIHAEPTDISTKGIRAVSLEDVEDATKMGASLKLIAHFEKCGDKAIIDVSPRIVKAANPLSTIKDVFNGILLDTNGAGQLMFFGRGAGKLPTASAVLSDIVEISKNNFDSIKHESWTAADTNFLLEAGSERTDVYVRIKGKKLPEGAELVSEREESVSFVLKGLSGTEALNAVKDYELISYLKVLA